MDENESMIIERDPNLSRDKKETYLKDTYKETDEGQILVIEI